MVDDTLNAAKIASADAREKLQAVYGEFNEKAKVAVEKSGKIIEELNELTKGNVEAVVESGKIAAKGAETLGQEAADYSRRSFEKATATMKRSEEHTSELQSLMRISYAVFCLKKTKQMHTTSRNTNQEYS